MDCSQPPPLSADQISAVADGDADPVVLAHLARCPACAARLTAAQQLEQALKTTLHRWDCPPAQRLADYHSGRLAADEHSTVVRHLQSCTLCVGEIAELRAFLAADAAQAPAAAPSAPATRPRPRLGELIAQILPRSPALALRGSATEPLMAEAGEHTILLDLHPGPAGGIALTGQFLAIDQHPWSGALVEVRQGGAVRAVTLLDELGGFRCDLPSADPAELRFASPDGQSVLLADLDLRQ